MNSAPSLPTRTRPGTLRTLWLGVTLYLLLNAVTQGLVSGTADQDQAEQLLLSQSWAWGYGSQPPLYTYLVKVVFLVTGPALWPLLGLKVALLSLLVAGVLGIGHELGFRIDQQLLALGGLALIPQFIWESQRDLSHSVLATAVAACTVLQTLRLTKRPSPANHAGLGALVALGLLSKYSFVIVLIGLLITAVTIPAIRRALLRPGLLLGVAVGGGLLAPHLSWALAHTEAASGGLDKAQTLAAALWAGPLSALTAAIAFLSPFWILAVVLLWPQRRRLELASPSREPGPALLQRLPLMVVTVMLVAVLATGSDRIKDRWYQSLLFYAPISVASLAPPLSRSQLRWVVVTGVGAATVAALLLPGRTALAGLTGKTSRPNAPLPALLGRVASQGDQPAWILASSTLLGGNARLVFPDVPVLTPKLPDAAGQLPASTTASRRTGLLLIDQGADLNALRPVLQARLGAELKPASIQQLSLPMAWAPNRSYPIRYAWMGQGS